MKKQIKLLSFIFALSIILFYSCSKSDKTTTSPSATPTPSVAGKWSTGSYGYVLALNNDNTYSYAFYAAPYPYENGTYSTANNILTLTGGSTYQFCSNHLKGNYNYSFSSDTLILSLNADTCYSRYSKLPGKYKKQ